MFGLLFFNMSVSSLDSLRNRINLLFGMVVAIMMVPFTSISLYTADKRIHLADAAAKRYRLTAYYAAKVRERGTGRNRGRQPLQVPASLQAGSVHCRLCAFSDSRIYCCGCRPSVGPECRCAEASSSMFSTRECMCVLLLLRVAAGDSLNALQRGGGAVLRLGRVRHGWAAARRRPHRRIWCGFGPLLPHRGPGEACRTVTVTKLCCVRACSAAGRCQPGLPHWRWVPPAGSNLLIQPVPQG